MVERRAQVLIFTLIGSLRIVPPGHMFEILSFPGDRSDIHKFSTVHMVKVILHSIDIITICPLTKFH